MLYAILGSSQYKVECGLSSQSQHTSCDVENLQTGSQYKFKVMTVRFNENSTESSEQLFRACVASSGFAAPTGIGNSSDITIS